MCLGAMDRRGSRMLRKAGLTMRLAFTRAPAAFIGGWLGLRGCLPAYVTCPSSACLAMLWRLGRFDGA